MIHVWQARLHRYPVLSICCGCNPEREYLLRRCWAEMECELSGLPVELLCGFIRDDEWNESLAKNAAASIAAPKIIFTNCDAVIKRPAVEAILNTYPDNTIVLCNRDDERADGALEPNEHAIGEFQAVSKELWMKAGGFDERLTGWGYIDYSFQQRCIDAGATSLTVHSEPHVPMVIHHWHPRLTDEEYRAMNQKNREICGV